MHLIIALLRDRTLDGRWQGLAVLPRIVMAAIIILYCEERWDATEQRHDIVCIIGMPMHRRRRGATKRRRPKDKKKPPEKTRGFQEVFAVFWPPSFLTVKFVAGRQNTAEKTP